MEKCPACGFRLDVDHSPCVTCRTGWGMHGGKADGTAIRASCHDTCAALKEWQQRQTIAARRAVEGGGEQ